MYKEKKWSLCIPKVYVAEKEGVCVCVHLRMQVPIENKGGNNKNGDPPLSRFGSLGIIRPTSRVIEYAFVYKSIISFSTLNMTIILTYRMYPISRKKSAALLDRIPAWQ